MSLNEILVGSCWWMQLCRMCSFQFWSSVRIMREHSQISFKHYSFIVIIVCFYSYKLLIRSPFCMNLMWYIFEGVVVSLWSSFHFVFWYEVQFLLSCWLGQCWSIWHVNFTFHFSSEKIDWTWIKQSAASQTKFINGRSGFLLLCSTLDYMHIHFFNLYVLRNIISIFSN